MNLQEIKRRAFYLQLNKSWQYLAYLYLLLPGLLFVLGVLLKALPLGKSLGMLFHNYGLFAISTLPNLSTFTGLVGLGLAGWFLWAALRRRDWLDFGLSAGLVALNVLYFYLEWNYLLLQFLRLQ